MFGLIRTFIWFLLKILLSLIFYGTPLIGFWVASSLAAYLGGPQWMAWIAGALLFPIIPGIWELRAWCNRRPGSKAWLTPLDRISLRTFAVGLSFLAALLYLFPKTAFVSLSTRGDWMLDEVRDPRTESSRRVLFAAAGGLEWLYRATKSNPYKAQIDTQARQRAKEAAEQREQELAKHKELEAEWEHEQQASQEHKQQATQEHEQQVTQEHEQQATQEHEQQATQKHEQQVTQEHEQQTTQEHEQQVAEQDKIQTTQQDELEVAQQDTETSRQKEKNTGHQLGIDTHHRNEEIAQQQKTAKKDQRKNTPQHEQATGATKWPWKTATLHRAVATMPRSVETSIQSVAHYLASKERDPVLRIKALHDYVSDRIAYDSAAYYSGNIPNQDAQSVFTKRKSVCAGYANLLAALAAAINEQIVVVTGDARHPLTADKLTGSGHAWNAARIFNRWYLIDACWDAGYVERKTGFTKCYKTDYLLIPPEVMIEDHFPDEPTWQLLNPPLSLGEFLRQPMLRPSFQAAGLTLVTPLRAQNETRSKAVVVLKNPNNLWLMAELEQNGKDVGYEIMPTNSQTAQLECRFPEKGRYRFNMFLNKERDGVYDLVGSLDFVNR